MITTLATVTLDRDADGNALPITLPRALWAEGLCIGDVLIIESDTGSTIRGVVAVDAQERPVLALDARFDSDAHRVTVRRPRSWRAPRSAA